LENRGSQIPLALAKTATWCRHFGAAAGGITIPGPLS